MSGRGGSRPGSGRKTEDNAGELLRKQVKLDQASIDVLARLGGGNLSLGIRRAARRLAA
ncbi:hypothetical protein Dolphis_59 [Pseudomonas phage Dolphis]|nr:hypothetical protein Dolphis_59 [Pseudomonas phage Dolphis]